MLTKWPTLCLLLSVATTIIHCEPQSKGLLYEESYLKIINNSGKKITSTSVIIKNPADWSDLKGPSYNFQGISIKDGEDVSRILHLNRLSSHCTFTMTLNFDDNTKDTFNLNQKFAVGKDFDGFVHSSGESDISIHRDGNIMVVTIKRPANDARSLLFIKTKLKIVNKSGQNITSTNVTEITRFDWLKGPADNFQNLSIPNNQSIEREAEVNRLASNCPFTMTLTFADGSEESFRINQKFAIGQAKADFEHRKGKRNITFVRDRRSLVITVGKEKHTEKSIWSIKTKLMVINKSDQDIVSTKVTEIDPWDWKNRNSPAANFQNVRIPKGRSVEREAEVNRYASNCPFTMTLTFADGSKDTFRINQKYAVGLAEDGFEHKAGKRGITFGKLRRTLIITVHT